MTIAAPKLEVLACSSVCRQERLRFDGTSSVRRLEKISLCTHGRPQMAADYNGGSIWLLQQCTGVGHVGLTLEVPHSMWEEDTDEDDIRDVLNMVYLEDLMGEVPTLPNITSFEIDVFSDQHSYESSLANLLVRCECHSLQYLEINVTASLHRCSSSFCRCHRASSWKNHDVPLPRLREVKITGISGTKDETSLVKLLIENATSLERMTVQFAADDKKRGRHAEQLLLEVPCSRGHWICTNDGACEWTRKNAVSYVRLSS